MLFECCMSNRWVHLLCALYTPDVAFVKPEQLQCVTLSEVPPYKWGAKVNNCSSRKVNGKVWSLKRSYDWFNTLWALFAFGLHRIVLSVKMSGFAGRGCALNVMVTNTIQCAAMSRNQTLVLLTNKWLQSGFCSSWFYQKLYVDLTTDHIFSEYYNNILFISKYVLFIFAFKINAKTTSIAYFYSH